MNYLSKQDNNLFANLIIQHPYRGRLGFARLVVLAITRMPCGRFVIIRHDVTHVFMINTIIVVTMNLSLVFADVDIV